MKKKTLMKKASVFAMLSVLTMTMFVQPAFAAGTYAVDDGGNLLPVSSERALACDRMKEMSQVEWTLSGALRYCYAQSGGKLTEESQITIYKYWDNKLANEVIPRKGIPYTQVDREHSFPNGFTLTKGTKTLQIGDKLFCSIWGTDCSSSIDFAWRKGTGNLNSSNFLKRKKSDGSYELYRTRNLFNDGLINSKEDGEDDYLMLVGKYGGYYTDRLKASTTKEIVEGLSAPGNYETGEDIYSKVYADMKPGDALLRRTLTFGHARLVTGVKIVYTDAAKTQIDPYQSYVTCIEQAGFRQGDGNWKTSWMPNDEDNGKYTGKYSFAQLSGESNSYNLAGNLIKAYYVPIKLKAFTD